MMHSRVTHLKECQMGKSQDGLRFTVVFNDRQDQRGAWSRYGEGGTPHVHTSQVSIFLSQAEQAGCWHKPSAAATAHTHGAFVPHPGARQGLGDAACHQPPLSSSAGCSVVAHGTSLPAAIHLRHCFLKFIDLLPAVYN